jgi:hypothetical protein
VGVVLQAPRHELRPSVACLSAAIGGTWAAAGTLSRQYATQVAPDGRPAIGQPLSHSHDLENAIVAFSKYKLTVLTIKQLMDVGMHTGAHGWDRQEEDYGAYCVVHRTRGKGGMKALTLRAPGRCRQGPVAGRDDAVCDVCAV